MSDKELSDTSTTPSSSASVRRGGILIALLYVCVIVIVCLTVRPLSGNTIAIVGLALFPTVVCAAIGLVKIRRVHPWHIAALFHVVVYPLLFGLVMAVPGVLLALELSKLLAK